VVAGTTKFYPCESVKLPQGAALNSTWRSEATEGEKEMATRGAAVPDRIELPKMDIRHMEIRLIGDSPLICHAWSQKAKQEMLDKQMKKAKTAKQAKDPWMDYCDSLHWVSEKSAYPTQEEVKDATFGFPAVGFKAAAVDACSHLDGVTKVLARGVFHIAGELLPIEGGVPNIREDMVRIGMGTADIRYRGEFKNWSVRVPIRYNAAVLSSEQIVNLFNTAGFAIGVGEWRPQKNGSYGMFHVAMDGE
jgi:hypothetical protein